MVAFLYTGFFLKLLDAFLCSVPTTATSLTGVQVLIKQSQTGITLTFYLNIPNQQMTKETISKIKCYTTSTIPPFLEKQ